MIFECWPVRRWKFKIRTNEFARLIKKYCVQGSCFRSNISETVRDIRVPFSLLARCKSHATKRYKRRCCSCYRFSDIIVVNIKNFSILLEQTRICRRTSSHGIIIVSQCFAAVITKRDFDNWPVAIPKFIRKNPNISEWYLFYNIHSPIHFSNFVLWANILQTSYEGWIFESA